MAIISDAVTATQSTINAGPLNGPEINTNGSRTVTYWDPASGEVDANGSPIFTGTGPLYSENAWDLVVIGGNKLPGTCVLKWKKQLQIDQQKGPKHDGSKLNPHGMLPARVDIAVKIWTQEQWEKYCEIEPSFWRKPLKDAKSISAIAAQQKVSSREAELIMLASSIFHPDLNRPGITQVIVESITGAEAAPEPQAKIINIACIEYQPPTKKTSPSKIKKAKAAVDPEVVRPLDPPSKTHAGPTDG